MGTVSPSSEFSSSSPKPVALRTICPTVVLMPACSRTTVNRVPPGKFTCSTSTFRRVRPNVEVEHVNLPGGTRLTVVLEHAGIKTTVGHIVLSATGFGELELNSEDGDTVPMVRAGDIVSVANGNTAVLAGAF